MPLYFTSTLTEVFLGGEGFTVHSELPDKKIEHFMENKVVTITHIIQYVKFTKKIKKSI